MNKTLLIGRLVAAPEVAQTATGKAVSRVTLAVNRKFKNSDGEREADFISLVFWGKLAESFASYAGKGSLLSVEGELRTRSYEKEGNTHYVTEVLVQAYQLLESRAQRAMRENTVSDDLADVILEAEELPF